MPRRKREQTSKKWLQPVTDFMVIYGINNYIVGEYMQTVNFSPLLLLWMFTWLHEHGALTLMNSYKGCSRETQTNCRLLQSSCIACNTEHCISHGDSVCPSVCHTLVLYSDEWRCQLQAVSVSSQLTHIDSIWLFLLLILRQRTTMYRVGSWKYGIRNI